MYCNSESIAIVGYFNLLLNSEKTPIAIIEVSRHEINNTVKVVSCYKINIAVKGVSYHKINNHIAVKIL